MVGFGMPLKGQPTEFINRLAGGHMKEIEASRGLRVLDLGKVER